MSLAWTPDASVARGAAIVVFLGIVGGLPVAVELTGSSEPLVHGVSPAFAGDAIALATPVMIGERLPLTLDMGLLRVADREAVASGRAPPIVTIEEGRLTLDLSTASKPVTPAQATPDARPSVVPQLAGFSSGALRLKRSTLMVIGPSGSRAKLEDVNASITLTRKGDYKLVGSGLLDGQQLAFDAVWSEPVARDGEPQLPLRLKVSSRVLHATLEGLLVGGAQPAFSGQAEFRLPRLSRFIEWAGLGQSFGDHLKALVISGPLEWSAARMAFARARVSSDGNQGTGALTIRHEGERIALDGTLAFEEIDLSRYLAAQPAAATTQPPMPSLFVSLDADLRISAARVRVSGLEMGKGAVSLTLIKGRLQADLAEVELEGGFARGQLTLNLNERQPRTSIKAKLTNVDAGRLLAGPVKHNALLGRANVAFEGSAETQSPGEIMSALTGRGLFELAEPGKLGVDVFALFHAARDGNVVSWAAAGKGSTVLDSLAGRFRLLNGALTVEGMQARSGSALLAGSGRIDIPGRLMDFNLASAPAIGTEGALGAKNMLLMHGTWEKPAISLRRPPDAPHHKAEIPVRAH